MKKLIFLIILSFFLNPVFSQEWTVIPYEDISEDPLKIISLFQDSEGNVWGGNGFAGRVIRWDGNTWGVFNNGVTGLDYESPSIRSIFQDTNGKILFCSSNGIAVLENGAWSNINTSNSGIPSNSVADVIEHDGLLWFTVGKNLASFDGNSWISYEIPDASWNAGELAVMDDGRIFISMINGDPIRRFDNGEWEIFSTNNSNVGSNYQYYVERVDGQTFWFGGPNGRANLYENGDFTPSANMTNWGMGSDYITKIAANGSKDDVWFGSGYGLHHLDDNEWHTFDPSNSPLTGWEVQTVMIAQDGKIWLSTENEILIYTPQITSSSAVAQLSAKMNVMPNPATELLHLELDFLDGTASNDAQIRVFNLSGMSVLTQKTNGQTSLTIDISYLSTGNYLLEYIDGQHFVVERFFKR